MYKVIRLSPLTLRLCLPDQKYPNNSVFFEVLYGFIHYAYHRHANSSKKLVLLYFVKQVLACIFPQQKTVHTCRDEIGHDLSLSVDNYTLVLQSNIKCRGCNYTLLLWALSVLLTQDHQINALIYNYHIFVILSMRKSYNLRPKNISTGDKSGE
jgi:hypothetical protein